MQATWETLDNAETVLEELEALLARGLPPGIPAHKISSLRGACLGAAQLLQQQLEARATAAPRMDEAWSAAPPSGPPNTSSRPAAGLVAGLRADREKHRNSRLNSRRQGSFSRAPPTSLFDPNDTTDPRDLDPATAAAAAAAFHAAFTAGSVPAPSPVIVRPGQRRPSGERRPSVSSERRPSLGGISRTSSEEVEEAMEHIIQPSASVRPDAAARGGFATRLKEDAHRGATNRLTMRRQGSFSRAPPTASRDEGAELVIPASAEERLAAAAAFNAQFVLR